MLFFKKNWLKGINNHNFGEYLEFTESNVFEIESVFARYNKALRKNKNKRVLTSIKAGLFIFAFLCCPLILGYLAIIKSQPSFYLYIELLSYLFWLACGIYLIKKALFSIMCKQIESKVEQGNLKKGLKGVLNYGEGVVIAFFEKKDEVKADYFTTLNKKELSGTKIGLDELEFDLEVFHDISRKSKRCNIKPLILKEEVFLERREYSKLYLENYYAEKMKGLN